MDINKLIDEGEAYKKKPNFYSRSNKNRYFIEIINHLCSHHLQHSTKYENIFKAFNYPRASKSIEDVPFLPVRLFKYDNLHSLTKNEIFKVLTSSGTSGQSPSVITLDSFTARRQTKTLNIIMKDILGHSRLPMIIIDFPNVRDSRNKFNARAAGIAGFSMFGIRPIYALNMAGEIDFQAIEEYLDANSQKPIFIFGFTFVIWQNFLKKLGELNKKLVLPKDSILLHGGGWKKLENEKISNDKFKSVVNAKLNIENVINYYGMVEQVGSIFTECSEGYFHTTNFNDVLIRNPSDFSVRKDLEKGLIQLLSILPTSYPGHSILTEDLGTIYGEDDCKCGKNGKYFKVHGRQLNSEPRGCSDVIK